LTEETGTPADGETAERAAAPADTMRIGYVVRAHGLRGELEMRLDWSDSRALSDAREIILTSREGVEARHVVQHARKTPKGIVVQLRGVQDRDAAEAQLGALVSVVRSELPPLAEGEYYLCDLVGLTVSTPEGVVGNVVDVQVYPSVDAIVIETPAGTRVEQPLLNEWIERVDLAGRHITLRSAAGLIES
jgi:16S rRNA processing protein RimM